MKQWKLLFVIIFFSLQAWSQTNIKVQMRGHIYDVQDKKSLEGASVSILIPKDSSTAATVLTGKDGAFVIDIPFQEKYYLYATYIGYKSILLPLNLNINRNVIDIGNIYMQKTSVTLLGVDIIGTKSPVRVTNDTVEFNASYYKLRENSLLEELLKRLPGVQIDADGTIRINGEIVKSILVDGHTFFSDDPKLATKNLQSDMIDKVQLINRNLKERDPTSSDGTQTEKAINITIKKSKKNIWTGQMMAGYGSENRFAIKENISRFKSNEQIAFFLNGDNINGLQDGGTLNGGAIRKWNPNFNYTKDINKNLTLSTNYIMLDTWKFDQSSSFQRNFSGDTSYYYNQQSTQKAKNNTNNFNVKIKYDIDSMSTVSFSSSFGYTFGNINILNEHGVYGNNLQVIDSGWLNNVDKMKTYSISTGLSFEKKFKRIGQLVNIGLSYAMNNKKEEIYNSSNTLYIQTDGKHSFDTVNQYNRVSNKGEVFQFMITHTLPVLKKLSLIQSYGLIRFINPFSKSNFNYNKLSGYYDQLNDSLSSRFESSTLTQFGSIGIQDKRNRYNYNISIFTMLSRIATHDLLLDKDVAIKNVLLIPRAFFNYDFTNSKHLRFFLTGNQILPTPDQLQPVLDNSNPLFIRQGNVELKPASTHSLSISYSSINDINMGYFSLAISGGTVQNQIINGISFDSLRRQISQPININGSYDFRLSMDNSFPIAKQRTAINANSSISFRKDMNYLNGLKGSNNTWSATQNLSYNYAYKEIVNFSTGGSISYFNAKYSDLSSSKSSYFIYSLLFDGNINLPFGLVLGSTLNYSLNTGLGEGFKNNSLILNTSISQTLFSKKRGLIKLQGFDIFNQNININRTIGSNYIDDTKMNTLQRFVMLSFTYYIK